MVLLNVRYKNSLIKEATFDSNLVVRFNNKMYPLYTNLIGLGISTYIFLENIFAENNEFFIFLNAYVYCVFCGHHVT